MKEVLVVTFLDILIITPFIFLAIDRKKPGKWIALILFSGFFILNKVLLNIPREYISLQLFPGKWNWSGKLYAIAGSLIFYFSFKKFFKQYDFFTLHQKQGSQKGNLILFLCLTMISILMGLFMFGKHTFSWETLGFQLTMPGFDEEIAFRDIMMGFYPLFLWILSESEDLTWEVRLYGLRGFYSGSYTGWFLTMPDILRWNGSISVIPSFSVWQWVG